MKPIYCAGTLKTGKLALKPCRKFLGNLSAPYADVICPRCGHKNTSDPFIAAARAIGAYVAAMPNEPYYKDLERFEKGSGPEHGPTDPPQAQKTP